MSDLKMQSISKSFDNVNVLDRVSISIKAGEIHALLGVNGAGKTTLMKILAGDYLKDEGTIKISGVKALIGSPMDAKRYGIGMVVQEVDTALFPSLSVAENIAINTFTNGFKWSGFSWDLVRKQAKKVLHDMNISVDVKKPVVQCSLSEKQMILIARAVVSKVRYLILDEPTAPLSKKEINTLFALMKKLCEGGVGIIYITHRMPEIKQISDRFTVMRDGNHIITDETKTVSTEKIIQHMLGKSLQKTERKLREISPKYIFEVKDIDIVETGKRISFTVREGEIVGVAGLVGAGKSETARALFGIGGAKGSWYINGQKKKVTSPIQALKHGLCLIPEERRKEGILTNQSVAHNLSLPSLQSFTKWGWLQSKQEKEYATRKINQFRIVTSSSTTLLKYLSGGNQQKVAIGKWVSQKRKVYLFDEPTKGIDVNAKKEIFQLIDALAEQGKGILYFTSELEELLQIADRILVMYDGEIIATFKGAEATHKQIMQAATGGMTSETNG